MTPLVRSDFTSDAAYQQHLAMVRRPSPLEAVKGVRPRSEFASEPEYREYLNSIRGLVYVEFFSMPVEDFSLARRRKKRTS